MGSKEFILEHFPKRRAPSDSGELLIVLEGNQHAVLNFGLRIFGKCYTGWGVFILEVRDSLSI
jgi:hypothetical protein